MAKLTPAVKIGLFSSSWLVVSLCVNWDVLSITIFPKFIKNKIYEIQELKHNNDEYDSQQI